MNPTASNYQHYCYQKRRKSATNHNTREDSLLNSTQANKTNWLSSLQNLNFNVDSGPSGGLFSSDHQPIEGSNFDLPEDNGNQKYTSN